MKKRWPLYLLIGVLVAALFLVSVQLTGNAAKNIFAKNPGTQKFPTVSIAPVCTTPTPVVTQSALFCPGVYNHSLTIQGNNIHLKCSQGTIFDGLYSIINNVPTNGLEIKGVYTNITIEGCEFRYFFGNGIFLEGDNSSNQTLGWVTLKNLKAQTNIGNGLYISHNTRYIDSYYGNYSNNGENGILIKSAYKDPARYNVNPDPYPKYFPNDVRIFNSTINENGMNGIYVNAGEYYRFLDDMEAENNTLIIEGNSIKRNNENGIKNTDFFVNIDSYNRPNYFAVIRNDIQYNLLNGIKIHTKDYVPPTGELNCNITNSRNFQEHQIAWSSIDYIYYNNLKNNLNGIELSTDANITDTNNLLCWSRPFTTLGPIFDVLDIRIFANVISENRESGIRFKTNKFSDYPFLSFIGAKMNQNIISHNALNGVYLDDSSASKDLWSVKWSIASIKCNDIRLNLDYGTKVSDVPQYGISKGTYDMQLGEYNIIEDNSVGGTLFNLSNSNGGGFFSSHYSHFANHPIFDIFINLNDTLGNIFYNDFSSSPLLAYDSGNMINWSFNWWSDYSPRCRNQNKDQWCDSPRPIPSSNQDNMPKAGLSWGNNGRGYLSPAAVGVTPLSSCNMLGIPPYPIRPLPPNRGNNNGGEIRFNSDG